MSYYDEVIADGPVAYYRLSESSGIVVTDSIGTANGTYHNGPVLAQPSLINDGDPNGSVFLDGSADWIRLDAVGPVMGGVTTWSVEWWMKAPAQNGSYGGVAFAINDGGGGNIGMTRFGHPSYGTTMAFEDNAGSTLISSKSGLTDNKIHHYVLVHTPGTLRLYVDGVDNGSIADSNDSVVMASGQLISFGQEWDGSSDTDHLEGVVDEIAFYKKALTAERILVHHAAGKGTLIKTAVEVDEADYVRPKGFLEYAAEIDEALQLHAPAALRYRDEVMADNPIAYWGLSDDSGTVINDEAGNNDGEYVGGAAIIQGGPGPIIDKGTGSVYINGSSTAYPRLRWKNPTFLPKLAAFTLECWIRTTRTVDQALWTYGGGNEMLIFMKSTSTNCSFRNLSNVINHKNVADGAWHQYVLVHDGGSTLHLYIDGVLQGSDTSVSTIRDQGTSAALLFGQEQDANDSNFDTAQAFYGDVSAASLYGTALSAARVKAHYRAGMLRHMPIGMAEDEEVAYAISNGIFQPINLAEEVEEAMGFGPNLLLPQIIEEDEAFILKPVNPPDQMTHPWVLGGESGSFSHPMTQSTLDAGEPNPNGALRTSWFQWQAPDSRDMLMTRFHTRGSDASTTLAVFTEDPATGELVQVVASGPATGPGEADVKFQTVAGTTYLIQLGVTGDPATNVLINWLNYDQEEYDLFATPLLIEGDYGHESFSLLNGTVEPTEPVSTGYIASSWLTWTADTDEPVTFQVESYDEEPFEVRILTGTDVGALTSLGYSTGTNPQSLTITPVVGTSYMIQVSSPEDLGTGYEITWDIIPDPVDPEPLPYPYPEVEGQQAVPYITLRAEVYEADGITKVSEVPRRKGVSFQEALNVTGVGSMMVAMNDPIMVAYPDLLSWGRIVKFYLGSKCVHAFMIRERKIKVVTTSEWSGMVREVSGPSVHYMLEDFIVRHDGDVRPDSSESRYFSWASKPGEWLNENDWDTPVETWPWDADKDDPDKASRKKVKKPKNWRVPEAMWMGATGKHRFFRKTFNVQEDGTLVRMLASSDDKWAVFLDGEEVMSDDEWEVGYTKFMRYDTVLAKGWHTVAIYALAKTAPKIGDGQDSVLFAMCELDLDGKLIKPPMIKSDASWALHRGVPPPGWNRAQVLRTVVIEAKNRGIESAQRLTLNFTGTEDSEGKPWPKKDVWNQEVRIGTTGLNLQQMLSEGNGFDVWVRPEDLNICAYRRRGKNRSASVTLEPGRNLMEWEVTETDDVKNTYLIKYDGGWTEVKAGGSRKTFGERESAVSLGGVKDEQTAKNIMKRASNGFAAAQNRAGTGETRKRPAGQPEGGLIGVPGAYPFLDFNVGDIVKAPNANGKLVPTRVLALSCTEDDNGYLSFDPDVEEIRSVR